MDRVRQFIETEPFLAAGLGVVAGFLGVMVVWDLIERGRAAEAKPGGKHRTWLLTEVMLWSVAAVCTALWLASGRGLDQLGLVMGEGATWLGAWVAVGLGTVYLIVTTALVALHPKICEDTMRQIETSGDTIKMVPSTAGEGMHFHFLSITAGITEEVIFRGFLIGSLALIVGVPVASGLALVLFIGGHFYQGPSGMLRILPISVILTLMFVLSGSLIPGIILHALVDVFGGLAMGYAVRGAAVR